MKGTTSVTTLRTAAAGFIGAAFRSVAHAGAGARSEAGRQRKGKRFGPALLLALPFLVALGPDLVDATRTIHIRVSRYGEQLLRVVRTGSSRDGGRVDCNTTFVNAD